ncbi:hypothetical protein H312_01157 [Anncaliia algerae PRA339]|uniref:Dolichol kinase n=1 Tax=Anncaliia algerae PRA339 TaxID=1288291 RepID=A0A059F2R8_9MICR|nr:hypothetical protein H312_01157 [Anncaliia algerae PRA339]
MININTIKQIVKYPMLEIMTIIFSLVYIFKNYSIIDYYTFFIYSMILSTYKGCFNTYELIISSISLVETEKRIILVEIFQMTHLIYLSNFREMLIQLVNLMTLFSANYYMKIFNLTIEIIFLECKKLIYYIFVTLICLSVQLLLLKSSNTNIKRKIFHFFSMVIYFNKSFLAIFLGQFLILIFIMSLAFRPVKRFNDRFKSSKDPGLVAISHILLLCSICYSSLFLDLYEYRAILIVICVLDSLSSIYGKIIKSKQKSLLSSLLSISTTKVICKLMIHSKYTLLISFMGVIEYLLKSNDNLFLPYLMIFFLRKRILISNC